jgi:hypothetical protein
MCGILTGSIIYRFFKNSIDHLLYNTLARPSRLGLQRDDDDCNLFGFINILERMNYYKKMNFKIKKNDPTSLIGSPLG